MTIPEPPIQIHSPRLQDLRMTPSRNSRNMKRVAMGFSLLVESRMTGQCHRLILHDPMLVSKEPRSADETAIRALFSDKCSLVSVFLERKAVEFSMWDGSIVGTVTCEGCEVGMPEVEIT